VLAIDEVNRVARVEAGITNSAISDAAAVHNFFYAPDPSSQLACTLAGNIAMNSGGAHCLKYGVTTNNLLALRIVLMNGEIVDIGGDYLDAPGYDVLGLIVGSEGQFGIVTEATVRLLKAAEGARPMLIGFGSSEAAGACVAGIIAAGIIPAAIEFMDKPAIQVCENFAGAGYPLDVEALLIVEVEGSEDEIDALLETITEIAQRYAPRMVRASRSAEESALIWKGRKAAFGAIGQISDYYCMDGVIPLSKLPEALAEVAEICRRHRFRVANIFHAGDGNLHPLILYNANDRAELERAELCGAEILKLCVRLGGCLTGEHGVGIEKRELMRVQFSAADLTQQMRVKSAFDPDWLLNPAKVFPLEGREL
jgi:glycolate oxidase